MFVESCKRLRIMKGSEAIGLGMHYYILLTSTFSFHSFDDSWKSLLWIPNTNNLFNICIHHFLASLMLPCFSVIFQHQEPWKNAKAEAEAGLIHVLYQSPYQSLPIKIYMKHFCWDIWSGVLLVWMCLCFCIIIVRI